jgi:hypothetical protein
MKLSILRPATSPNRDRLAAAIEERKAAEIAANEARATLERFESVVGAADNAARKATAATAAANEGRQRWVRGGCQFSDAKAHQALADAATAATRAAERLSVDAKAVAKEFERAREALKDAEKEIRWKAEAIADAEKMILVAEAADILARGQRLKDEYREWRIGAHALWNVVDKSNGYRNEPCGQAAGLVLSAIDKAAIPTWEQDRDHRISAEFVSGSGERKDGAFEQAVARWRERLMAVRGNPPDAE